MLPKHPIAAALLAFSLLVAGLALAQATARPTPSGDCPRTHPVKGNIAADGERIYHVPGGRFYGRTDAEVCFRTPADAVKAGYRASRR